MCSWGTRLTVSEAAALGIRRRISSILARENYLQQRRVGKATVRELEILDVEDLEWLELAVEKGQESTGRLLSRKHSDSFGRGAIPGAMGSCEECCSTIEPQ
jgi:hypothetical protein